MASDRTESLLLYSIYEFPFRLDPTHLEDLLSCSKQQYSATSLCLEMPACCIRQQPLHFLCRVHQFPTLYRKPKYNMSFLVSAISILDAVMHENPLSKDTFGQKLILSKCSGSNEPPFSYNISTMPSYCDLLVPQDILNQRFWS